MRHSLLVSLVFLVSAAAVGAEKPIPQDTAQIEKRRRERLEWNRRTLEGAYDKVGKKDPRWDKPARKALDLAARMFSNEVDPVVTQADIYRPARAAVDGGCDDPLVRYLYVRSQVGPYFPGVDEAIRRSREVDNDLADSRYPAIRRMAGIRTGALNLLAYRKPSDDDRKEAERSFDRVLALLDESVKSDERNEFWEDRWYQSLVDLVRGYRTIGIGAETAYERVDRHLARLAEVKLLRLLLRGKFWLDYGWEARGSGFADSVPEGDFAKLQERLAIAKDAYEDAWKLRPGTAEAATGLLEIERSVGGDRDNMELWFDRAMKADGDNRSACWTKLEWLEPKWHGKDAKELVAFGRDCGATNNWRAGITLLLADAHWRYSGTLAWEDKLKYLQLPEVWADIRSVFDEYLKHYPDDAIARSKYATYAYYGKHYPEAHAQYEALGDRLTQWSDTTWIRFDEMKRQRNITARVVAGEFKLKVGWHRLVLKNNEGKWRIDTPGEMARGQLPGILGVKARNVWTCTAGGITYTVRVQLVPPSFRDKEPIAVLEAARAVVAEERGGKARVVRPAEIAEHPGLPAQEYLIDGPALKPNAIRVRAAVHGNRLYELSVTASEADITSKSADAFLNSLAFQE